MTRVFISQPMNGKSDEEIKASRAEAANAVFNILGDNEVEIINSFFEGATAINKPLALLSKSIELLAGADVAYFCDGWENSRGCRIEHTCAVEYGLCTIEGNW